MVTNFELVGKFFKRSQRRDAKVRLFNWRSGKKRDQLKSGNGRGRGENGEERRGEERRAGARNGDRGNLFKKTRRPSRKT